MTGNGMQGSFSAHDTLTYVLNEAQKAGQKHVTVLKGDWLKLVQATKGMATKFQAPDGEIILLYDGYWFHKEEADPSALKEEGYLDLTGDEPMISLSPYRPTRRAHPTEERQATIVPPDIAARGNATDA